MLGRHLERVQRNLVLLVGIFFVRGSDVRGTVTKDHIRLKHDRYKTHPTVRVGCVSIR